MIQPTFPRTQGTLPRDTYLTLLLLALVDQAGGELHLSASALERLDNNAKLLTDWDTSAQQLIIRSATSSLVISEVRGAGWLTNPTAPSPPSPTPPGPSATHSVMTEEALVKKLEERLRADAMRQWREQGSAAVAGMPPPDEPTPR
jgi:hypothetical protein